MAASTPMGSAQHSRELFLLALSINGVLSFPYYGGQPLVQAPQTAYQQPQTPQAAYQQPVPQAGYFNVASSIAAPDTSFLQGAPPLTASSAFPASFPQMGGMGVPQPMQPPMMQSAQSMNFQPAVGGVANVNVQDFLQMADSMRTLQATANGLEQQLLQTQSAASRAQQEAQKAHARSDAAEANAAALHEQSQKIASMAEVSVGEAKQSMEKERSLVDAIKKQLKESEAAKTGLEAQLAEAQNQARVWKQKAYTIQQNDDAMIRSLQEQAETQLRDERSRLAELGSLLPVETQRRLAPMVQGPRDGNQARQQDLDGAAVQHMQQQQQRLYNVPPESAQPATLRRLVDPRWQVPSQYDPSVQSVPNSAQDGRQVPTGSFLGQRG